MLCFLPAVWLFHPKTQSDVYILASQRIVLFVLHTIAEASAVFSGGSKRLSALSSCVCFFQNKSNQIKSINPPLIHLKYEIWNKIRERLKPKCWLFWEWFHNKTNSLHGWIANTSYWSKVVERPFYHPKLVSANKNVELLFTTCLNSFRQHFPTLKPTCSCRLGFLNKIFQVTAATWRYCSWAHRRRACERKPRVWAEKRDTSKGK